MFSLLDLGQATNDLVTDDETTTDNTFPDVQTQSPSSTISYTIEGLWYTIQRMGFELTIFKKLLTFYPMCLFEITNY